MHQRHMSSCFNQTLKGWNKQSPQKHHNRQYSFLHQLQQNLSRYEDQSNRIIKSKSIPISKLDVEKVRLPILGHLRTNDNISKNSNINVEKNQKQIREYKCCEHQIFLKNAKKVTPLRMKTLVIYERNQNELEDGRFSKINKKKEKRRNICQNMEKQKMRKKVFINFQRIKQIGINLAQFSDQKFFKDMTCMQEKSSSVKLYKIQK